MPPCPIRRRPLVLAALCLCAFAVNLDVTLVNVTLPRLTLDLGATTRDLQWVVDAYTLAFAALVLPAGSLGDRFGRRGALLVGLVVYGVGNGLGGLTQSTEALIATRALMGVGAAIIFPTTLSIITNVYTERAERAKAIGIWGAVTGVAIALGPIAGGVLLEASTWQATFLAKVPVAIGAIALVALGRPDLARPRGAAARPARPRALGARRRHRGLRDHRGAEPRLGVGGDARAVRARPSSPPLFIVHERRTAAARCSTCACSATCASPPRRWPSPWASSPSRASSSSIIQYFQFLKGYGPLETGLGCCRSRRRSRSARSSAPRSRSGAGRSSSSAAASSA